MERQGDIYSRQLEMDRISTLLQGSLSAGAASKQASATRSAGRSSMMGSVVGAAVPLIAGAAKSQRPLKENILQIGESPSGINIYSFNYKKELGMGNATYQGVMADEVPRNAIISRKGYELVDYNKIHVDFKKIN